MKIPRDLSGRELADALSRHWSYREVHQSGSHIILETEHPSHQRIAVPAHRYLKLGTLNAILRMVASHKRVSREDIFKTIS
jgi:predicted RNA binding protein YcfA (HicA-like mRNA interferase family)